MNILLVAQMGAGKDVVAEILTKYYNYKTHKLGHYIRKHVDEIFSHLDSAERRPYYQKYGETLRESISIDIWNDACFKSMSLQDIADGKVVIADARQPHEVIYWSRKGFVPIGIDVPDEVRIERLNSRDGSNFTKESFQHSTEINAYNIIQQIKNGTIEGLILDNSGNLDDLIKQIDSLFGE